MSDCIFIPQNYDVQAVNRFLRGEDDEICIELKAVDWETQEGSLITDATLQLDLIKSQNPHSLDVRADVVSYPDSSGSVIISFVVTEKNVGLQDYRAIRHCGSARDLLGASRLFFAVSSESESREWAFEFSPISGALGKCVWHEVDSQSSTNVP